MHVEREPIVYEWSGPFPSRELPTEILYDIRIRFRHSANGTGAAAIASALETLGGEIRTRRLPILGTRYRLRGGRIDLDATRNDDHIVVRVAHRLKGNAMPRLVEALARVPGAKDLRIEATTPHFMEAYSDRGPCTPCAARSFPARR